MSVGVDIAHSYIGDLEISLVAPSGPSTVLHSLQGMSSDDIRVT